MVSRIHGPESLQLQAELCKDSIDWCNEEKHTFLRQRIEARLAGMYVPFILYALQLGLMMLSMVLNVLWLFG